MIVVVGVVLAALEVAVLIGWWRGSHGRPPKPPGPVSEPGWWGPLPGPDRRSSIVDQPIVWKGSRLVLSTIEDATWVLDCLVPGAEPASPDTWMTGVPIALRAHPLVGLTSQQDADRALDRWLETGASLDISLAQENGVPLVRIAGDDLLVTLELEAASPTP